MEKTKNAIEDLTSAEAYVNRGDKLYDQGDYQAAISDYDEAIRLDPNHITARTNREKAQKELRERQNET